MRLWSSTCACVILIGWVVVAGVLRTVEEAGSYSQLRAPQCLVCEVSFGLAFPSLHLWWPWVLQTLESWDLFLVGPVAMRIFYPHRTSWCQHILLRLTLWRIGYNLFWGWNLLALRYTTCWKCLESHPCCPWDFSMTRWVFWWTCSALYMLCFHCCQQLLFQHKFCQFYTPGVYICWILCHTSSLMTPSVDCPWLVVVRNCLTCGSVLIYKQLVVTMTSSKSILSIDCDVMGKPAFFFLFFFTLEGVVRFRKAYENETRSNCWNETLFPLLHVDELLSADVWKYVKPIHVQMNNFDPEKEQLSFSCMHEVYQWCLSSVASLRPGKVNEWKAWWRNNDSKVKIILYLCDTML